MNHVRACRDNAVDEEGGRGGEGDISQYESTTMMHDASMKEY